MKPSSKICYPFFSIILPTRDRPELVRNFLKEMVKQEYKQFEIIISDNYKEKPCLEVVKEFMADERVVYKTPGVSMSMCDHWNFALQGYRGDYVNVINEKLVFRKDALQALANQIVESDPDTISWQYDVFVTRSIEHGKFYGHYHPLMKSRHPVSYDSISELRRRLSFEFPLFSRYMRMHNNYSRIYTSFVKRGVLDSIVKKYGVVFPPISPDFTSLVYILGFSRYNIDIGQSLMLNNYTAQYSNGASCGASLKNAREFVESHGIKIDDYLSSLPINGILSQSNSIARDYAVISKEITDLIGTELSVDMTAIAYWSKQELNDFIDIPDSEKFISLQLLDGILSCDKNRVLELESNSRISHKGSEYEIYHSGLRKIEKSAVGASPEDLADIHWIAETAPPRESVLGEKTEFSDAFDYFDRYHRRANQIIGIK